MINFNKTEFIKSASGMDHLPPDVGAEVAIVGRSNAGKSSALNLLTHNKKLARVSKEPGRTQLLNFFGLEKKYRLVDLPGYGFAKVSLRQRNEWSALIEAYLRERYSLCGLLMVMDVRHPLKPQDEQLLVWCFEAEVPVHVLLNKADKLGRGAANNTLQKVRSQLSSLAPEKLFSVQTFSAQTGLGLDECRSRLAKFLTAE